MDVLSITILTIPILYPASLALGIDPVHFGVLLAIVGAMGTVTPPFGVVVFAIYGATKEYNIPLYTIFWGVIPFCFAMLACCLLVLFFPQIATFLPSLMWTR